MTLKNTLISIMLLFVLTQSYAQEIEMTNDSINMLDDQGVQGIQLVTNALGASINLIGVSESFPLLRLESREDNKFGSLSLRDVESSAYIIAEFEGLGSNRHPILVMESDSTLLRLTSGRFNGDLRLFSRKDRSGLEIIVNFPLLS